MQHALSLGAFVCPVTDLERAAAFYSQTLGLTERLRLADPPLVVLDASEGQIWLLDYAGRLEPGGRPTQIVLFSADVDAWHTKAQIAGCEVTQELHDDPLGRLFIFKDSEGNLLEIRQPGGLLGVAAP
jgi:predicted enzyme related to lactoylglutathione lyase